MCERSFWLEGEVAAFGLLLAFASDLAAFAFACAAPLSLPFVLLRPRELDLSLLLLLLLLLLPLSFLPFSSVP